MSEAATPEGFEEFKAKHPEFFPPDQSLDKQIHYFKAISARQRQAVADKRENFQKLDNQVTEATEERERRDRAETLLKSGKFIETLKDVFNKKWCGDSHILHWIVVAFVNGFIQNNDQGLHLYIAGPSGLGKSEGVKAALSFLPKKYVLLGQFSRMGFMYKVQELPSGTIVLYDDHKFGEEEAGLYRAIIAGWRERQQYFTVEKMASKPIPIPERVTQIITSADGLAERESDGQNESRFITIEISRDKEALSDILEFIKANQDICDDPSTTSLINSVWEIITEKQQHIEIPFMKRIRVDDNALKRVREFKKFLCVIRSVAFIRGRTTASEADFKEAAELWTYITMMIDNEIPGLSKPEQVVFSKIRELSKGGKRVELSCLKSALPGMQQENIYRAIRGREGNFQNPKGGLLTKIRGLSIEQKYDKDSGESDRIITLPDQITIKGDTPYHLDSEDNHG